MVGFNTNRPDNDELSHPVASDKTAKPVETSLVRIAQLKQTPALARISSFVKEAFKEISKTQQEVIKNVTSPNHSLGMRHSLSRVKQLSIAFFKKLGEGVKQTGQALSQNHVVRKLKNSLEYLQSCDFSFVRKSMDPFLKEELDQIGELLAFYLDFAKNEDKLDSEQVFNMALLLLNRIADLELDPKNYQVRNAMMAEVLTKHVVAHPLPANCILPIPCFNKEDKPVVVNYHLGR